VLRVSAWLTIKGSINGIMLAPYKRECIVPLIVCFLNQWFFAACLPFQQTIPFDGKPRLSKNLCKTLLPLAS